MTEKTDEGRDWSGPFAIFATLALVAMAVSFAAVVLAAGEDEGSGGGGGADTAPVHVSLTEFAISPSPISVPQGGSLHVTNDGSAVHNLQIVDQDLQTADLPGGGSEELDVSSLEPGTYEVLCLIPGHADSGMTATLEVTEGGAG